MVKILLVQVYLYSNNYSITLKKQNKQNKTKQTKKKQEKKAKQQKTKNESNKINQKYNKHTHTPTCKHPQHTPHITPPYTHTHTTGAGTL